MDDFHGPPAQDVGGPDQDRVTDAVGDDQGLIHGHGRSSFRLWDLQGLQGGFELMPVFRPVDGLQGGPQDLHSMSGQGSGYVDGRLATELDDHAQRPLQRDHLHHVFRGKWLAIEPIGNGEVGGDGLRVVVDDDRLVTFRPQSLHAVDGGVIELHPLPYADGAGTKDDHLAFFTGDRSWIGLIGRLVGRVEVRGCAFELAGAGIDHLVDGDDAFPLSQAVEIGLGHAPGASYVGVGEAVALEQAKGVHISHMLGHGLFQRNDLLEMRKEEVVYLGDFMDFFRGMTLT